MPGPDVPLTASSVPRLWRLARLDFDPVRLQRGLSGGEPLARKDLEALAAHARRIGLYTTLVTSGVGLTRARAEALREAGLEHVQISIQDTDAEAADRIAGMRAVSHKQAAS